MLNKIKICLGFFILIPQIFISTDVVEARNYGAMRSDRSPKAVECRKEAREAYPKNMVCVDKPSRNANGESGPITHCTDLSYDAYMAEFYKCWKK